MENPLLPVASYRTFSADCCTSHCWLWSAAAAGRQRLQKYRKTRHRWLRWLLVLLLVLMVP